MATKSTEASVTALLARKHGDDVFVPQCKTGWTPCPTLDAWALKKSWASPATYGYEIKVSRSDFLRDDKWTQYLDFCNYFSFVAPFGIIAPDEVADGVGLILVSKTGTRLYTKKKPQRRDVDLPMHLVQYVLQSRTQIVSGWRTAGLTRPEFWRKWLAKKEENRELGHAVSSVIRDHVHEVERKNRKLQSENEALEDVRSFLIDMGIDPNSYRPDLQAAKQLELLTSTLPPYFEGKLTAARNAITALQEALKPAT